MARIRWVTKAQVAAAKLAVDLAIEEGEEPDPLMVKIAAATPMHRPKPGDPAGTGSRADDSDDSDDRNSGAAAAS